MASKKIIVDIVPLFSFKGLQNEVFFSATCIKKVEPWGIFLDFYFYVRYLALLHNGNISIFYDLL
jgi:hypothetical protein